MVRRQSGLNRVFTVSFGLDHQRGLRFWRPRSAMWSFQRTYNRVQTMPRQANACLGQYGADDNVSLVEDDAAQASTASGPVSKPDAASSHTKTLPATHCNTRSHCPPHEQQTIIDTIDNPDLALLFDYPVFFFFFLPIHPVHPLSQP